MRMKTLKVIEPEIIRAVYYYPERVITKGKWLFKRKRILSAGYYEADGITPITFEIGQNFILDDRQSDETKYLCSFGKVIYEDEGKVVARRIDFRGIQ